MKLTFAAPASLKSRPRQPCRAAREDLRRAVDAVTLIRLMLEASIRGIG
jgi:hypothetical protein